MKKPIERQQENVKALMLLAAENPDLRIVPMVDSEVVASDDFGWWTAEWGEPSIEELWGDDERVYIRSDDEEDLIIEVLEDIKYDSMATEEAERDAAKVVDAYEWEKIIAVRITTI